LNLKLTRTIEVGVIGLRFEANEDLQRLANQSRY